MISLFLSCMKHAGSDKLLYFSSFGECLLYLWFLICLLLLEKAMDINPNYSELDTVKEFVQQFY